MEGMGTASAAARHGAGDKGKSSKGYELQFLPKAANSCSF